ncbi:MAG: hypothetical protein COU09_00205 [Candidatus Harrisonbacteria bacterium CG10_big_fil_rev_8_21_14_0_10_44_23]|uniref:Uncharacterized protein n=1 Tax=Candidatus Harrisonbacteria bacterium CG10_big_fil_rev_8_21_14_0_10_44_23 TaxID=1974585 RepID=A0A2H0UT63_9BACT|nr:MAG: hypothetical protein COU09_00205 [Candidatus Harrisonbacteria bacterium CG10_big_fil_rev_8_21_14_0_10_44_23]
MAIKINQPRKGRSFTRLIAVVVIFGVVFAAIYFLFFAPAPGFDYIAPSELERNEELASFDLDPKTVFNSDEFQSLEVFRVETGEGNFGRTNPFVAP